MPNELLAPLAARLAQLKCVVVVGLPGTGKSLLVRAVASIAAASGRKVHLLQWDVVRTAWDRPEILARFPEIDGVTHAAIRSAIGLWIRTAMADWFHHHGAQDDLLIVEAPIIGGRFAALAQPINDALEVSLQGAGVLFVVMAPTQALQQALRQRREREVHGVQHALERHNASVAVLDMQVLAVEQAAKTLGLSVPSTGSYDPDLYSTVMRRVLKHRQVLELNPGTLIPTDGSVYDLGDEVVRLEASAQHVATTIARVAALSSDQLREQVELGWALT